MTIRRRLFVGLAWATWGLAQAQALSSLPLDQPMGEDTARAMLGRFGYGPTQSSVAAAAVLSPRAYLARGIAQPSGLSEPVRARIAALPSAQPLDGVWAGYGPGGTQRDAIRNDAAARMALQRVERLQARGAIETRLLTMANSDNPAHEALHAFWLNHFSIYVQKGVGKLLGLDYARQIETAMPEDSFEALLRASFFHPAMQIYLDNEASSAPDSPFARAAAERGRPLGLNENLARELLELHTLGVDGGYTQADVQALARIITGASVRTPRMAQAQLDRAGAVQRGLFLFDPRRHDFGAKILLGETFPAGHGIDEIERALRLLAHHPSTARHIATKLAQRFVSDSPDAATVSAVSAAFTASGGQLSATLNALIATPEFAASLQRRSKFREPLDQILFAARAACQDQPITNSALLVASGFDQGQNPLSRTTPDGYGALESDWLSPAAMAKRLRFAMGVAAGRTRLASGPSTPEPSDEAPVEARLARLQQGGACNVDEAAVRAAVGPLSESSRTALDGLSPTERIAALLALPEAMHR